MNWLSRPSRIFVISFVLGFIGLMVSGTFGNIYNLLQTRNKMEAQLQAIHFESEELRKQIQLAKDPRFLESQAVDRFDLAEESDLVFVFSEF